RVPARGRGGHGPDPGRAARRPRGRGRPARLLHGRGARGRARPGPGRPAAGAGRAAGPAGPGGAMSDPELSVVIPAYNEALRLPPTLEKIRRHLDGSSYEVLVVDDGSRDDTALRAQAAGARVVRNEGNRGKGYSVRRGMLLARGARRLMCDADLSTPIEELGRLRARMDEGYDV